MASRGEEASAADLAFFESRIRPLLSQECYECHSQGAKKVKGGLLLDRKGGWERGGDSGPVIVPGKPEESLLVKMVERDPEFEAMPPKTALKPEQVADLREWIARGAPDPRAEAVGEEVLASGFDLEERKNWWSLQPVASVAVPPVTNESWPINEVDRFLLAEIEKQGWEPSGPAEKEQLLRRVSLLLTGLAPTEAELDAFLADESPDAYERVVDRLLASPHFGERWARHWMDVVRFAETKAFEADYTMPYAHRYRDYLIRAFNDDVPYDQFVREALAGDLLAEPRLAMDSGNNESAAGPGYLYLTDGQHGPPDVHGDEARVFDDMIKVTGVAFQGLTLACAKCHDHKFDAITDKDYYSFYGMLRSSRLHYANVAAPARKAEAAGRLKGAKRDLMGALFAAVEAEARELPRVLAAVEAARQSEGHAQRTEALNAKLANGETREERAVRFREASIEDVAATSKRTGVDPEAVMRWLLWSSSNEGAPELAVLKGLVAGSDLGHLRRQAGHVERTHDKQAFGLSAESFGEWLVSGPGFEPADRDGFVPALQGEQPIRAAVGTGATTGTLAGRLDGVIRSPDFTLDGEPVELWVRGRNAAVHLVVRNYELVGYGPTTNGLRVAVDSDRWQKVRFATNLWKGEPAYLEVMHHGAAMGCLPSNAQPPQPADDAWAAVAVGELPAWGSVWLTTASEETSRTVAVAAVVGDLARLGREGALDPAQREVLGALMTEGLLGVAQEDQWKPKLDAWRRLTAEVPEPVYVRSLVDGEPQDQRVYVRGDHKNVSTEPNPRHFLDGLGGEILQSSGSGRLEWANHVASPGNPLTARVRVNRIWARVFGRGLVASVDDFGKMGELPSHPELLDYLARDFVQNGWSTKALIRKLVLTRAFRMSSTPRPGMAGADPKNKYLTHMALRRMEAEAIRDHILACSGELDRGLFGSSVPANLDDQPESRAKPRSGPLDGNGRRSIYLELRRNYLPSFLRAFDMPNATEPAGKRNVTNVPAQSLALLNDAFVHQQAEAWGRRIMARDGSTDERIATLHRQAFGREATPQEIQWARRALDDLGGAAHPEQAWAGLCHLMINRKEFIYVF